MTQHAWTATFPAPDVATFVAAIAGDVDGPTVTLTRADLDRLAAQPDDYDGPYDGISIWVGGTGYPVRQVEGGAVTEAADWETALNDELRAEHDGIVSDQISHGYASGAAGGVALAVDHPDIDEERGVIVSSDGRLCAHYDRRDSTWSVRAVTG